MFRILCMFLNDFERNLVLCHLEVVFCIFVVKCNILCGLSFV